MRSHATTEIAAPSWGGRSAGRARAAAPRNSWRPPHLAALPGRAVRPLELRVGTPRLGAAILGGALAAGFTLLWVFLLLGVVGPAAGLR
jgi:hypothetical protein